MQLINSLLPKKNDGNFQDEPPIPLNFMTALAVPILGVGGSQVANRFLSKLKASASPEKSLQMRLGAAQGKGFDYPLLLTPQSCSFLSKQPYDKREWTINLLLMMDIYKRTKDLKLKHLVSFLTLNYLAKAAPICFDSMNLQLHNKQIQMFQRFLNESESVSYNRESPAFDCYLRRKIAHELASSAGKQFFIIDTKQLAPFFSLWFSVIEGEVQTWEESIVSAISDHVKRYPENPFE